MTVRKIQFAPDATGAPGPKADICKSFMMSDKPVHLQASLEKEVSYTEGLTGFYSNCSNFIGTHNKKGK